MIQACQTIKEHVSLLMKGKPGLLIPDSRSSKYGYVGMKKCSEEQRCPDNKHIFGWRDYFDIIVRWRQVKDYSTNNNSDNNINDNNGNINNNSSGNINNSNSKNNGNNNINDTCKNDIYNNFLDC